MSARALIDAVQDAPAFAECDVAARAVYDRDGVICLRQAFASHWLARIGDGIAQDCTQPHRFFRDETPPGSPAKYLFGFWSWPGNPALRDVVLH
jgi:hypothetical protein